MLNGLIFLICFLFLIKYFANQDIKKARIEIMQRYWTSIIGQDISFFKKLNCVYDNIKCHEFDFKNGKVVFELKEGKCYWIRLRKDKMDNNLYLEIYNYQVSHLKKFYNYSYEKNKDKEIHNTPSYTIIRDLLNPTIVLMSTKEYQKK